MGKLTIAAKVVQTLVRVGVHRIHGVVGDSLNGIVDEIRRTDGIDWISYRHEEAAAFAAGAEAQLTGKLAVCAGSCGPGNLHLINGLYDANRSMAPVLAIAAHIPSSEVGTGYFQETHPDRLFVECSHYCELISSARQMPRVLHIAMQHAVSKQGVAVIALSGDVAMELVQDEPRSHGMTLICPAVRPSEPDLQTLANMLNSVEKVTLLCGNGCAGAHDELIQLGERLKSPMVHSLRGKEHVEYDNPYDVGMTGLIGFPSGYRAIENCDLLLMLGCDFPYKDWYPQKAKIAQVDIRVERLGQRCRLDLGLVGDVLQTIQALLPMLETKSNAAFLEDCLVYYRKTRKELDSHARGVAGEQPIYPEYLATVVSELATDDAIFTCDVGSPTVWAARYLKMTKERRLLGSFNHGSMANAMPQAIGAQIQFPNRQVISLSGDGGFTMMMGDLLTISQHNLPVKVVIFNNGILGFVAMEMKVSGFPLYGIDMKNPNFAKMAEAIGILGIRVEDPAEVKPAIKKALEQNGPVLLDVLVNPSELSLPPKIELNQAWGFSMYMLKETLSGHGDEVVQTIQTNFLNKLKKNKK